MNIQTVRLAGSLQSYSYRVNRPNIALHTPKAKGNAKKKLGAIFGMVGLSILAFSLSFDYWSKRAESEKEDELRMAMENFISYNPSRVKITGFMDENTNDEEYMVIEYKGKFLGYDKNGNAKYSLPKPHYLYLKKDDYKLEK